MKINHIKNCKKYLTTTRCCVIVETKLKRKEKKMRVEKKEYIKKFYPENNREREILSHLLPIAWDRDGKEYYFTDPDDNIEIKKEG